MRDIRARASTGIGGSTYLTELSFRRARSDVGAGVAHNRSPIQAAWRAVHIELSRKSQVITKLLGDGVTSLNPEEAVYATENTPANFTRAWDF
jgi:hypothetical protein